MIPQGQYKHFAESDCDCIKQFSWYKKTAHFPTLK